MRSRWGGSAGRPQASPPRDRRPPRRRRPEGRGRLRRGCDGPGPGLRGWRVRRYALNVPCPSSAAALGHGCGGDSDAPRAVGWQCPPPPPSTARPLSCLPCLLISSSSSPISTTANCWPEAPSGEGVRFT